jgi:hypothetical protein
MYTYYFTFGIGSKLVAINDEYTDHELTQKGISLANKFVVVEATSWDIAREKIYGVFGRQAIASSYDEHNWPKHRGQNATQLMTIR